MSRRSRRRDGVKGSNSLVDAPLDEAAERRKAADEYRNQCTAAERESCDSYDKHLITLAGGAFGVSAVFCKEIVGARPVSIGWLSLAWIFWGLTLIGTLASFYSSARAHRKTIQQIDADVLYKEKPGGRWGAFTVLINPFNGLFFMAGILSFCIFFISNLSTKHEQARKEGSAAASIQPASSQGGAGSAPAKTTITATSDNPTSCPSQIQITPTSSPSITEPSMKNAPKDPTSTKLVSPPSDIGAGRPVSTPPPSIVRNPITSPSSPKK